MRKSDSYLASSSKYYTCQYVRDMTESEVAEHKNKVDDIVGGSDTKTAEVDKPRALTPADTKEK